MPILVVKAKNIVNKQRIHSLDLLRGFALLGILIMNIVSFSNIGTGYINPTVGAGIEGYNAWIHAFGYLFADTRFMSIFSMLFGAGVIIFSKNIVLKNLSAAKYHYRRMGLLLIFGMIHAYLIWMGDILLMYAICGSIIFLVRHWSVKKLYILGTILFLIPVIFSVSTYLFAPDDVLSEISSSLTPSQLKMDREIIAYRGSYLEQMTPRIKGAVELQTFLFLIEQGWRILSMMILGMILFNKNILDGSRSKSFYTKLFLIGMSLGLAISSFGLWSAYAKDWNGAWYMLVGHMYNYIASLVMALGYIGLIMLWFNTNILKSLQQRLMAVGKLAFTNYILSSLICTFIFYGHGLGLFATMDRLEYWGVILFVWLVILMISPLILKKYRYGPLEWVWRKLTYL